MWYVRPAKLLTEHHLEFLSLKGGCTGLSEPTFAIIPHSQKSGMAAQIKRNGKIVCLETSIQM